MTLDVGASGVRLLVGAGALARLGDEAAAIGARALVVSPAYPDPHEASVVAEVGRVLRAARLGHHPFPRVRRPG